MSDADDFKISYIDGDAAEHCSAVMCVRIEDMPTPHVPAHEERCSECGARIWVANNSPKKPPRFCMAHLSEVEDLVRRSGHEVELASRSKRFLS